jgi:four helix bundle protein
VAHVSCRGTHEYKRVEDFPRHETCAFWGMHNPRSDSILEHALEVVELCRPLVEVIQRRDRDLASQLRRALSSVALNLAEGFGNAGGHARMRFETAQGSLHEACAGLRLAIAWHYVTLAACAEALKSLDALGARVFGLVRR